MKTLDLIKKKAFLTKKVLLHFLAKLPTRLKQVETEKSRSFAGMIEQR
jgi:hypothetical protein